MWRLVSREMLLWLAKAIFVVVAAVLLWFVLSGCARRTTISAPTTTDARRATADARVLTERNAATLREQGGALSRLTEKRDRIDRKLIWLLEQ